MAGIVHVVGTGTIGEPLVALLSDWKKELGIREVTFYKHTPRPSDRPLVRALREKGARMAVLAEKKPEFEKAGIPADLDSLEALERADVVIDATPEDLGLENKEKHYSKLSERRPTVRFLAQGSEEGFGLMYALGINDSAPRPDDRFFQVVSCNTHSLARLVRIVGFDENQPQIEEGRFVLIRRAADVGEEKFLQAPKVEKHKEALGTHHATDLARLYRTVGADLNVFSSALKLNTPYMHTVWFNIRRLLPITRQEILRRFEEDPYASVTEKESTNSVFAFAREHGPYGRILNQTVLCRPSLHVSSDGKEVTGFAFTPQDGNVLLSNVALVARSLTPEGWKDRVGALQRLLRKEW